MTNAEAMKILIDQETTQGKIGEITISVVPGDIRHNIRSNDYVLDVEQIQDLTSMNSHGDYELFQGHSLSEVELVELED